ncbi:MAG: sulfatase-like hydrolase/transferase, partial [Oscillospiraceae bacterium]|nr:sulfatase-like hydrolase/transferase [Oscillospiraceae bacterium]
FAPYFLKKMLLHSALSAAFLCTLNQKPRSFFNRLLTGLLLCVYCQYMFMNSVLPVLGVNTVDWSTMTGQSVINAAVWILLLLLPFAAGAVIKKVRKGVQDAQLQKLEPTLCGILGGIQLVTLIVLISAGSAQPASPNALYLSGTEQFTVSKNKNIITFILDATDQEYFETRFAADPESAQILKDFTCFSNTAMQYDSTYLSIPSVLTAARTYPETTTPAWYHEICSDEPARVLYQRLHDNNYKVNVYGDFSFDYTYTYFQDLFDNLQEVSPDALTVDRPELYRIVSEMSAYRALPLFLKKNTAPSASFGNEAVSFDDNVIYNNIAFSQSNQLTPSESAQNYFIVQHLMGLHNFGTGQFKWRLDLCLSILEEYFAQLKQNGVYDDALIIVTADHGQHVQPKNMPIFYIKKPHETHDAFETSRAPICLSDFAATVLDAAGLSEEGDEAIFGRSIFAIPEDEQRTRLVFQRKPFSNIDKIEWKRYSANSYAGTLFGYYFTGTKDDLAQHELNDPPDLVLETDGYR